MDQGRLLPQPDPWPAITGQLRSQAEHRYKKMRCTRDATEDTAALDQIVIIAPPLSPYCGTRLNVVHIFCGVRYLNLGLDHAE